MVLMSIDVCSIEISSTFNHNRSFPFSTMRYYSHSTKSFVNKWFYSASTKQFICSVAFHVYKGLSNRCSRKSSQVFLEGKHKCHKKTKWRPKINLVQIFNEIFGKSKR